MPKPPNSALIETTSLDHAALETVSIDTDQFDRLAASYIRLGAIIERNKTRIESDAKPLPSTQDSRVAIREASRNVEIAFEELNRLIHREVDGTTEQKEREPR